jgi:LacI family transcriptional regulator
MMLAKRFERVFMPKLMKMKVNVKPLSTAAGKPLRPTIFSVAKGAGVSITTVSHILNYPETHKYSSEVESKVLSTCKQLNYKPNALAKSLANQTNSAIGVLCQSLDDHNITRALSRAVELAASHGLHVVVSTKPSEIHWQTLLEEGRVGWIIAIMEHMVHQSRELMQPGLLERVISVSPGPVQEQLAVGARISWDENRNGRLIVDHLASLGHHEIAFLVGANLEMGGDRNISSQKRGEELGLTIHSIMDRFEDLNDIPASGERMMKQILETHPDVTAVICRQDYQAIGVYRQLMRVGKHVPDDMAVVGNFNLQSKLFLDPGLTSVSCPSVEGIEKAMEFIMNPDRRNVKDLDLTDKIELVIRGSTQKGL